MKLLDSQFRTALTLLISSAVLAGPLPVSAAYWDLTTPGPVNDGQGHFGRQGPMVARDNAFYTVANGPQPSYRTIVRWMHCSGNGGWSPVPLGVVHIEGDWTGAMVDALVISGNQLYVGGSFDSVADQFANVTYATNIAKLDISTSKWSAVGNGSTSDILAIAVDSNGLVYIGLNGGGDSNPQPMVKKWNGTSWVTLGQGSLPPRRVTELQLLPRC